MSDITYENGIPTVNGIPMAKIYVGLEEKIGLADYSNVVISASVSRYIPDTGDADIAQALKDLAQGTVEDFISEERRVVLEMVKKK